MAIDEIQYMTFISYQLYYDYWIPLSTTDFSKIFFPQFLREFNINLSMKVQ